MPPSERVLSPAGGSTLITSAPSCARIMPQVGPITIWVISTTLTPSSGNPVSAIPVSFIPAMKIGVAGPYEKYNLCNAAFAHA